MTCRRALLVCGSSGLTLAHLPALRAYVRRFARASEVQLVHGAGEPRRDDAPDAFGADWLWEVAASVEWPRFRREGVDRFRADWKGMERRAGRARNELMREALRGYARRGYTVGWVAAHTDPGLGRGTRHMVSLCRDEGWPGRTLLLSPDGALLSEECFP
ncbi:hypothetical protein [Myxococcus sp. AS-1-15]|uniref:hypothetical protein n=1 Tax=Myxococcus sp. AS-1-15 TaxID=2874600 RepID=UPI001CBFB962|nr:hypothetical protein [Myxococcus sp. AS-1-15]MBZ4395150.1 hypothetical protein [Myxococcus sp. AS-1-15]